MKKRTLVVGTTALAMMLAVGGTSVVSAYNKPQRSSQQKQAWQQAIENKDYDAWLEVVGSDSRVAQRITREKFAEFADRKLTQEGNRYKPARRFAKYLGNLSETDREALKAAIEEIDYEAFKAVVGDDNKILEKVTADNFAQFATKAKNKAAKFKRGFRQHLSPEKKAELETAIESGDYQAWKEIVGDRKIGENINEDNFARFTEMVQLKKAGEIDEAKAIADELGLKRLKN